ncbi:MAG: fused MFS/spermidine synthase [Planctomycetes bacterium]|nr:fused MFS/spermidine synthase [Planctomycetota bacterium]
MNTPRGSRALLLIYAATVFVSAFLLFQVQPLISRVILPWFGGSPAVWTTCMLFFQSVLFLGYAYAHATHGKLTPRWQAVAHLLLLLAALALARIEPSSSWKPHDGDAPMWRIMMLLAACVGLPYFVLATTGPLLQAWFSRSYPGRSPYRLYALSNLGSLIALLSYPFWFEPRFALSQQANLWFWGFAVFVVLCGLVASQLWRRDAAMAKSTPEASAQPELPTDEHPTRYGDWILWLALPAFGSFMLLATTNHVCQDVAVVPFLWVVPLSVYLLSFIVAFDHPRWYRPLTIALLTIASLYAVGAVYFNGFKTLDLSIMGRLGPVAGSIFGAIGWLIGRPHWLDGHGPQIAVSFPIALVLYFSSLFFVCLLCHGQLARMRPAPRHLTSYYLMIAGGGALGGLLVSIVAPLLFNSYLEWKIGIIVAYVLAMLVALFTWFTQRAERGIPVLGLVPLAPPVRRTSKARKVGNAFTWITMILVVLGLSDVMTFLGLGGVRPVAAARNFYGTVNVKEADRSKPQAHGFAMFNGSIVHGFQFSDPAKRTEPTAYYSRTSGIGRTLAHLQERKPNLKVGAVGLGVGTLATYAGPQSQYRFYEINPAVERFARDVRFFSYLSDRAEQTKIILSDARLSLEREPPQKYDVLVLDAFSGDAIPTHLLTREAFEIYRGHLAPKEKDGIEGTLAVHITNTFLDLRPVVLAGAEQLGLTAIVLDTPGDDAKMIFSARWMILTRDPGLVAALTPHATLDAKLRPIVWTDDHSDLFKLLVR